MEHIKSILHSNSKLSKGLRSLSPEVEIEFKVTKQFQPSNDRETDRLLLDREETAAITDAWLRGEADWNVDPGGQMADLQAPAVRKRAADSLRQRHKDPEFKKRFADSHRKAANRADVKRKTSETMKKLWKDPEFRAKHAIGQSKASKIVQNRPEVKAKNRLPAKRKKLSLASKRYWSKKRLIDLIHSFDRKEWMKMLLDMEEK